MTIPPPIRICAIVPAFKVRRHIIQVVKDLLPQVEHVFVVDDACPERSGQALADALGEHARTTIVFLEENQGVGGAVMAGYQHAAEQGYEILVKVDGDGQMDPALIPDLVAPILAGDADYAKGNRFFDPESLHGMPPVRILGNAGLSFLSKLSTGYWHLMDPTNGFTALHADLLPLIHPDKVERRYFFETDMLFRLGLINAQVADVPMPARYADETSNLRIGNALFEFGAKHGVRFLKRLFYTYFLRNFSVGSLLLLGSVPLTLFGLCFGIAAWIESIRSGQVASAGTIMLAALPTLIGVQFFLSFLNLDMSRPKAKPLWQLTHIAGRKHGGSVQPEARVPHVRAQR